LLGERLLGRSLQVVLRGLLVQRLEHPLQWRRVLLILLLLGPEIVAFGWRRHGRRALDLEALGAQLVDHGGQVKRARVLGRRRRHVHGTRHLRRRRRRRVETVAARKRHRRQSQQQ